MKCPGSEWLRSPIEAISVAAGHEQDGVWGGSTIQIDRSASNCSLVHLSPWPEAMVVQVLGRSSPVLQRSLSVYFWSLIFISIWHALKGE